MSDIVRYEQSFDDMIVSNQGDYVLFEDCKKRIEELEKQLKDAQIKGFKDGWEASGEGYNSEYGANTDEVVNDYINDLNSGE